VSNEPHTKNDQAAGFTLIELLVVVAVIGILMAISVVSMLNALDRARQRATMADMRSIGRAIEAYEVDNGFLPANGSDMAALGGVLIPYQINVVPQTDHWRNGYNYSSAPSEYTLESYGKDGIDGTNVTFATRFDFNLDIVFANGQFASTVD